MKARVVSLEIKFVLRTVLVLIHLIQDAILIRKASLELEAVLREESGALQRGTIGNESCTAVISCIEQNGIIGDECCTGGSSCDYQAGIIGNGSCIAPNSCKQQLYREQFLSISLAPLVMGAVRGENLVEA